ncbi:hypothetical protein D9M72_410080 [compost metagenome]
MNGQVGPVLGLVEIGERGAAAAPARGGGAVHRTETFLAIAVQVLGLAIAGLLAGLDKGAEQRADIGLGRGHVQRAVAAMVVVGALVVGLGLAEVGQAVGVAPVLQRLVLCPAVVVHGVAADIDHAIDQRRTAQPLAAALRHAAVVHMRLGLGHIGPVISRALQRIRQRRRHLGAPVQAPVRAPSFQQQHRDIGILGQPRGQHAAGRARADDDVVVLMDCLHGAISLFA